MYKLFLAVLGMWAALTVLAADVAAGKNQYTVCVACHGANGEGNVALNAPEIAGQKSWYVVRQLENFKSGVRGTAAGDVYGAQMAPMAATLPDTAAVENVAAYIETLAPQKSVAGIGGDVVKGKALYTVCAACHGQQAEGNQALGGPELAGQADWYLVRQLQGFKAGHRGTNPQDTFGMQMEPMAATLADDQAIKDVVAYIKTL